MGAPMLRIDLNADLGEGFGAWTLGADEALLEHVTSANVACGFHAGDPRVIDRTVAARRARAGVAIGAHPSHFDLRGLRPPRDQGGARRGRGRRALPGGRAARVRLAHGAALRHVKPHGALYNQAVDDAELAAAIARGAARASRGLVFVGLAGSQAMQGAALACGLRYRGRGLRRSRLRRRRAARRPLAAGCRRERPASRGGDGGAPRAATASCGLIDGAELAVAADTLCLHGDNPNALGVARAVRERAGARGSERPAPWHLELPAARPARQRRLLPSSSAPSSLPRRTRACARSTASSSGAPSTASARPSRRCARCSCSTTRRRSGRRPSSRELEARLGHLDSAPADAGPPPRARDALRRRGRPRPRGARPRSRALGARAGRAPHRQRSTRRSCWASSRASPTSAWLPSRSRARAHATPRVRVPAGSVGLAGRQTGVYPVSSPGGWQLIGRTSVPLLRPLARTAVAHRARRPRSLRRRPGLKRRLERRRRAPRRHPRRARPRAGPAHHGAGWRTLRPSALGRGMRRSRRRRGARRGEPRRRQSRGRGGARVHGRGAALEFLAPVHFAVAGADLGAVLERADLGDWPPPRGASVLARPGNRLRFTGRRRRLPCLRRVSWRDRRAAGAGLALDRSGVGLRRARRPCAARGRPHRLAAGERRRTRALAGRAAAWLGPRARGPRTAGAALRCRHTRALPRGRVARRRDIRPHRAAGSRASRSATTRAAEILSDGMVPDRSRSRRTAGRS